MQPRTSEFSARSAAFTTCWYHSGKFSARVGLIADCGCLAMMRGRIQGSGSRAGVAARHEYLLSPHSKRMIARERIALLPLTASRPVVTRFRYPPRIASGHEPTLATLDSVAPLDLTPPSCPPRPIAVTSASSATTSKSARSSWPPISSCARTATAISTCSCSSPTAAARSPPGSGTPAKTTTARSKTATTSTSTATRSCSRATCS